MPKQICVHIGTGKAGSTAIQSFCAAHSDQLRRMGVHYWGLNLEGSAPSQRFPWQCPTGTVLLQRLSDPQASEQLPDGAKALGVWRWRLAKRSIPTSEPWPLMIERIATSSIHHCGKRTPRRMRQAWWRAVRPTRQGSARVGQRKRDPRLSSTGADFK